jgi:hypothetical protein
VKLKKATTEKLGDVFIRLGEAAIIGAAASLFVDGFPLSTSVYGIGVGCVFIGFGLYLYNQVVEKGE